MATTAKGTPFVESSDLVANYPGVSLALANHIDTSTGKVLQVLSVTKVDPFTTTSTSFVDITGMTVNVTPSATSSKILVLYKLAANPSGTGAIYVQMMRGATVIGSGTAVGNRGSAMSVLFMGVVGATTDLNGNFLDSPASVAAQTYKLQIRSGGVTAQVNVTNNDTDAAGFDRLSSTITVMEISA